MASALTRMTESAFRESERLLLSVDGLNDEALLDKFLDGGDSDSQDAFRELVNRHGPMVLGVCRHILDHSHDAEDAFQATFLALARHARSVRNPRALGTWLYEVAYRVAIRARARSVRRRTQEREAAAMAHAAEELTRDGLGNETDPAWTELRPVLHEEINRLPEKYRSAVVLCYLEGRTNEEAAQMLQWPTGTVKGRLSRARELLRSRLARRGFGLSAAFLAMSFSRNAVFAEVVPWRLAIRTAATALSASVSASASAASTATAVPISPDVLELADEAAHHLARIAARRAMTQWALAVLALIFVFGTVYAAFVSGWFSTSGVRNGPGVAFPNSAILPASSKTSGPFAAPGRGPVGSPALSAHRSSCFEISRDQ